MCHRDLKFHNFLENYLFWMFRHALERPRSKKLIFDGFDFVNKIQNILSLIKLPQSLIFSVLKVGITFIVCFYYMNLRWNCKKIFRLQPNVTTFLVDRTAPSHPDFVQTIPQRCVYTPGGLRGLLEA